jgi:DNA-binding transcriptional MerR regulator
MSKDRPMITSHELARLTGLSYREVDYWTRRGVLVPDRAAHGSGTHRGYPENEARVGVVVTQLRRYGMPLDTLARAAEQMREWDGDEWSGHVFITDAGEITRTPTSMTWWLDLDVVAEDRVPA